MTRKDCLEQAMGCVLRDRNNEYGQPEDCFDLIADLWTAYTGHVFIGSDVAAMMALLKLARLKRNARHLDSAVDLAGYAACFAECASAEVARPVPFAPKAKGNSFQNGNGSLEAIAEPEFKPGDRVQYRGELPSVSDHIWVDATYLRRAFDWQEKGRHIVTDEKLGPITVEDKDIRSAPKAEGCEELVQDNEVERVFGTLKKRPAPEYDAPQTKEELYQRIVDCNPATFKPRTPTGEELAEMAEEEAHG